MNIGLDSVSRGMPPQSAAGEASRRLMTDGSSSDKRRDAASPADDFSVSSFDELAKVAGEEAVDERALRRDDDLGKLILRAFDPASSVLLPLNLQ